MKHSGSGVAWGNHRKGCVYFALECETKTRDPQTSRFKFECSVLANLEQVFVKTWLLSPWAHISTKLHYLGCEYLAVMVDTRNTHRNWVGNLMGKFSLGKVRRKCDILTDFGCETIRRTALMWSALNSPFLLLDTRLVRSVLFYQSRL